MRPPSGHFLEVWGSSTPRERLSLFRHSAITIPEAEAALGSNKSFSSLWVMSFILNFYESKRRLGVFPKYLRASLLAEVGADNTEFICSCLIILHTFH